MGPFLFIIYANDLPLINFDATCILDLYANDTTKLISDNNIEHLYNKAFTILSFFSPWFSANKLALNGSKTNFMIFTRPRSQVVLNERLQFDGYYVTRVDFVRYLGYAIDSKLTWDYLVTYVCNKISKDFGLLKRFCNVFPQSCLLSL